MCAIPKYSGVAKTRVAGEECGTINICNGTRRERKRISSVTGPAT